MIEIRISTRLWELLKKNVTINRLLEAGITVAAVVATLLNINQVRVCWLMWMLAGLFWFVLLIRKKLWILFIAEFGWQALNIYGWIQWGR